MKKPEILTPKIEKNRIRDLESGKYRSIDLESAAEAGFNSVYGWFEDMVINERAIVKVGKDESGNESATIIIKPEIPKYKGGEYYTDDPEQIIRLKKLAKGETIIVELPEDSDFNDKEDS